MKSRVFLLIPAVVFFLSLTCLAPPASSQENNATINQGIVEYSRENYEEALQLLMQDRIAEGKKAITDYYIGLCQKQMGNYPDAVTSFTSAVQGQPPHKEAVAELVSTLVSLERPDEALTWIQWAEKENVKPKEVALQKGLILSKKKRYSEARSAFVAARSDNPEIDQTVDSQIAMTYQMEGKAAEARASYKAIVTRYPGTDVATFAQEYEQRMSVADSAKHWNLFIGANYLYDDNVMLSTPGQPSNAFNQSLRFEYDKPLSSAWSTNLQYSFQNSNYAKYHAFDMLNHGLTASVTHTDEFLITSLPLNISHYVLDYRNNSLQYSFKPTGTFIFAPQHLGMLTLGYTRREMSLPPSTPVSFTTGNIYNGQLSYIYLFAEGQGMATLRGELFYEDTMGSDNQNLGSRAGADLLLPLGKKTKMTLSAEGAWQDYNNSVNNRYDTTVTASASLNQKLCDYFFLNLQYIFTRAMSNISDNDYRKNQLSAGFELRF